MSSGSSVARELLAAFVAGRVSADRLVPAIAAEYYRTPDAAQRDALRPVMEVIERAAPGVARLARTEAGAGFEIQLAERSFPETYESSLKEAAANALEGSWGAAPTATTGSIATGSGFWSRLIERVRRLFSASA